MLADRDATLADAGVAGLRIAIGALIATLHGWHKVVDGWRHTTAGAEWPLLNDTVAMGFPAPIVFATAAALSQFIGGWLMAAGLLTRVAAVLVSATLLTAVAFNVQTSGPDAQLAAVYALVSGAFVLIGGGRFSLDGYIRSGKWSTPRRTQWFALGARSSGMSRR